MRSWLRLAKNDLIRWLNVQAITFTCNVHSISTKKLCKHSKLIRGNLGNWVICEMCHNEWQTTFASFRSAAARLPGGGRCTWSATFLGGKTPRDREITVRGFTGWLHSIRLSLLCHKTFYVGHNWGQVLRCHPVLFPKSCVRDRSKQQLLSTFIYLGDVVETKRSGENVLVGKKDHNKVRASSMSTAWVVLQDLTRNPG